MKMNLNLNMMKKRKKM